MFSKENLNIIMELANREYNSKIIYRMLADLEINLEIKEKLECLSKIEEKHEEFLKSLLGKRGVKIDLKRNKIKIWILRALRIILGIALISAIMEFIERSVVEKYMSILDEKELNTMEKEKIKEIIVEELDQKRYFYNKFTLSLSPYIKNTVIGLNDGLVEIIGIVMGLSLAFPSNPSLIFLIVLIESLIGGASLFIGYFMAGRFQREAYNGISERFKLIFRFAPERALEEFRDRLVSMGIERSFSEKIARELPKKGDLYMKFLFKGFMLNEFKSALCVSISFIFGMLLPAIPFLIFKSTVTALLATMISVMAIWFLTAFIIAAASEGSLKRKFLELVFMTIVTSIISYGLGLLIKFYSSRQI